MDTSARSTAWVTHPWVAEVVGQIRFGVGVSTSAGAPEWGARKDLAQAVDELGFDSLWTPDHPGLAADPWTTLAALAGVTRRIRLGPLVSCVAYRSPVQLARLATDVDRLSGGRLILGLGAGAIEWEFALLGLSFPGVRERQAMLAETVQILHGLWGTSPERAEPDASHPGAYFGLPGPPPFSFAGAHYRLADVAIRPVPVQRPRIPLMIAGGGERVTLRQVAAYADLANIEAKYTPTPADIGRKLAALRDHCTALGRPADSVVVTHLTNPLVLVDDESAVEGRRAALPTIARDTPGGLVSTPRDAIAYFQSLIDAGLRYFTVNLSRHDDVATPRLLAERVLPALQPSAAARLMPIPPTAEAAP